MKRSVFAFMLVLVLSAASASAQTGATLAGVVQDSTGAVLAGAKVVAQHVATGATRQATTGLDGRFTIAGLTAGNYEVRSDFPGFRPLVRAGIALTVGENAAVILTMEVGATDAVTVTAATSQVNTRSSG
ncbi:MAG: carboxypeptidase regulatory-like domain-containing protein [Acidobacteria bacterium]|nr:carboxypeptidase regulatory-like domain-containing protein [Acidobacteriota bacterium]